MPPRLAPPGPVFGDYYEIEAILAERDGPYRSKEYLVKWLGYPPGSNSWEPRSNLTEPAYRHWLAERRNRATADREPDEMEDEDEDQAEDEEEDEEEDEGEDEAEGAEEGAEPAQVNAQPPANDQQPVDNDSEADAEGEMDVDEPAQVNAEPPVDDQQPINDAAEPNVEDEMEIDEPAQVNAAPPTAPAPTIPAPAAIQPPAAMPTPAAHPLRAAHPQPTINAPAPNHLQLPCTDPFVTSRVGSVHVHGGNTHLCSSPNHNGPPTWTCANCFNYVINTLNHQEQNVYQNGSVAMFLCQVCGVTQSGKAPCNCVHRPQCCECFNQAIQNAIYGVDAVEFTRVLRIGSECINCYSPLDGSETVRKCVGCNGTR